MALTRKQKAFVGELLSNPKQSAKGAALVAYGKPDKPMTGRTAEVVGSALLRKPEIMAVLRDAAERAEDTVLSVMDSSSRLRTNPAHAGIALSAARDVLDRVHGKPTQRVEQVSTTVSVSINLTQSNPTPTPDQE